MFKKVIDILSQPKRNLLLLFAASFIAVINFASGANNHEGKGLAAIAYAIISAACILGYVYYEVHQKNKS